MAYPKDHTTCDGCVWLEAIAEMLPHDKTPHVCRERNWGGYVRTDAPNCLGRKGERVWAMKFSPTINNPNDPEIGGEKWQTISER